MTRRINRGNLKDLDSAADLIGLLHVAQRELEWMTPLGAQEQAMLSQANFACQDALSKLSRFVEARRAAIAGSHETSEPQ